MTREERDNALKVLKNYDLNFHKINGMLFSAEEIANAFDLAIKALEQESVIDKIRAEIKELRYGQPFRKFVVDECLKIIDKYKAESEK